MYRWLHCTPLIKVGFGNAPNGGINAQCEKLQVAWRFHTTSISIAMSVVSPLPRISMESDWCHFQFRKLLHSKWVTKISSSWAEISACLAAIIVPRNFGCSFLPSLTSLRIACKMIYSCFLLLPPSSLSVNLSSFQLSVLRCQVWVVCCSSSSSFRFRLPSVLPLPLANKLYMVFCQNSLRFLDYFWRTLVWIPAHSP